MFVCMYVCACACAHEIKRQGQCTRMHAVTMHSLTLLALERGREGERERGREGERESLNFSLARACVLTLHEALFVCDCLSIWLNVSVFQRREIEEMTAARAVFALAAAGRSHVCMCVCVYACVYVCMCVCGCACVRVRVCMW